MKTATFISETLPQAIERYTGIDAESRQLLQFEFAYQLARHMEGVDHWGEPSDTMYAIMRTPSYIRWAKTLYGDIERRFIKSFVKQLEGGTYLTGTYEEFIFDYVDMPCTEERYIHAHNVIF